MIRVTLLYFSSLFFLVNLFSSVVHAEVDKANIKFLLTNGDCYGAYSGGIKTGHLFDKAELVNELGHQAFKNTTEFDLVMKEGDESTTPTLKARGPVPELRTKCQFAADAPMAVNCATPFQSVDKIRTHLHFREGRTA